MRFKCAFQMKASEQHSPGNSQVPISEFRYGNVQVISLSLDSVDWFLNVAVHVFANLTSECKTI